MSSLICGLINIYIVVLLARAILSWFPVSSGSFIEPVNKALGAVTEPVIAPVRKVVPPLMIGGVAIDTSFLIVIVVLELLSSILC
jgi:YggT family protein